MPSVRHVHIQLMDRCGEHLTQKFGRGFEAKNLRRMVQFAHAFAHEAIVATLSRQLSWSHVIALLPLKPFEAPLHYAVVTRDSSPIMAYRRCGSIPAARRLPAATVLRRRSRAE
jgi:hypothetical protein